MSCAFDLAEFRHVVSHFATGVVVVCGNVDGELVGFAAQSFVSLSLEPPLVLFCPQKTSTSWPRIRKLDQFSINVLASDQGEMSDTFAIAGEVPSVAWKPSPEAGSPVLEGVLAYIDCRLENEYEGGDHTIVVASVTNLEALSSKPDPLLFFQGIYGHFAPQSNETT